MELSEPVSGYEPVPMVGSRDVLWSHRCSWVDLLVPVELASGRGGLDLGEGWQERWSVTWRVEGEEVSSPLDRTLRGTLAGLEPMRGFTWRRAQRHRPGLPYMVSTGRLHGSESLEEAKLLLALDFDAQVTEIVSQPLRICFTCAAGERDHTPDYLVRTRSGVWLIDVRPAALIKDTDRESFAAAAEMARACGWGFAVAAGWLPHVMVTLDWFSSQRRPKRDPLGVEPGLLAQVDLGTRTFGELAASSDYEPVARAQLLHLLWHRRLGLNLHEPLGDGCVIASGEVRG
ncbi:TnsA-like heteromeric transposase endonuclease subunit [Streptomyces sp. APSN-46.1]|uniref:TnsA-like heteromeric transposase endonuclease subunit n=1 Tax=Streptomyces sp. APSN-46.1 TaxID=2929049 RepID=UPI001FB3469E|nr:TnsA-like heteromeric transposase endonuclease subunit [Streptomyces sp. APSN-46.1]MCJ1676261.1 TnsA-like heteromeric transposase endonuclease subunit [Streptomyces sp. APSN-46.1]